VTIDVSVVLNFTAPGASTAFGVPVDAVSLFTATVPANVTGLWIVGATVTHAGILAPIYLSPVTVNVTAQGLCSPHSLPPHPVPATGF
jgi:hypothetical protein